MQYSLIVHSGPYSSCASRTALNCAQSLLAKGHTILRVFFYQDGVINASTNIVPAQDIDNIPKGWRELVSKYELDAVVCVASALSRGILSAAEAERYEKSAATMDESFSIGGLGLLVEAVSTSERILSFGD